MAIEGRTPREAADSFCSILNALLSKTITRTPLQVQGTVNVKGAADPVAVIAFRDRRGMAMWDRLASRKVGRLRWFVSHKCGFVELAKHHYQLETIDYTYHLAGYSDDDPFLRWEYVKHPDEGKLYCRHHIQGPITVNIGEAAFQLDDFHVPTGFVTLEEIVQFCLHDLEVKALSSDWHSIVSASYEKFAGSLRKARPAS